MTSLHVIGIGNPFRSDDGVGVAVIDHLTCRYPSHDMPQLRLTKCRGDVAGLVESLAAGEEVVIIDALNGGGNLRSGEVIEIRLGIDEPLLDALRASTHNLGVAEAIELARVLGCLPDKLTLWGIVGENFAIGETLSPAVAEAACEVAGTIWSDCVTRCTAQPGVPDTAVLSGAERDPG